jgi:8-oxo-dGTP diphosphatase
MLYSYEHPHPAVTTDVVLFTIRDEELQVLLIRRGAEPYKGQWALPGGFIDIDEDLEDCAKRELEEETGVTGVYLEQLYTFGTPHRDPRERVISVTYYALVPSDPLAIRAASDAEAVEWFPVKHLPQLAFDHKGIITMAHERLAAKLNYSTIALQFMPEKFTLTHLQSVYEVVLGERLDKRNFRKRVLAMDCIEGCGEQLRQGNYRPAKLYQAKSRGTVVFIK